jgi:hypothetical protein
MITRFCTAAAMLSAVVLAGCDHTSGLWGDDEFDRYTQRLDSVTDSAGDAKEVNRVIQTDHPWPRYAFDRRIPVDGQRMSNAVENYRSGPQREGGSPGNGVGAAAAIGAAAGAGAAPGAAAAQK